MPVTSLREDMNLVAKEYMWALRRTGRWHWRNSRRLRRIGGSFMVGPLPLPIPLPIPGLKNAILRAARPSPGELGFVADTSTPGDPLADRQWAPPTPEFDGLRIVTRSHL